MSPSRPRSARPQTVARWEPREARRLTDATAPRELGERLYGARLLGGDPSLVLAGGGNCSLKTTTIDLYGEPVETLFVKASGADLATAGVRDFTPLALAPTRRLLALERLSDRDLERELLRLRLDPQAPPPSVETLLHALLPFRAVDHAHPDALAALMLTPGGGERIAELFGEDCLVVPYVKPGHALARRCQELWRRAESAGRSPRGLVLLGHGLVAGGDDVRESYERLLELVARAARRLPRPRRPAAGGSSAPAPWTPLALARARAAISRLAGRPLCLSVRSDAAITRFLARSDLVAITGRGPLTPDHLLRTKRRPLLVRSPERAVEAVERYAATVAREFERLRRGRPLVARDPAPRILLVPGTGILGVGATAADAALAAEIYAHTAWAIERAEELGGYRPLAPRELFEVEHWELEQAKLDRGRTRGELAGRVALVTGSAGGIGRAAAQALADRGAAVVGLDLRPTRLAGDSAALAALVGDARSTRVLARAVDLAARRFGGLDLLVLNAGVFFAGPTIEKTSDGDWRATFALNLDAQLALLREAIPLLRLAPAGGAVVVVGSKNVRAPGPGAAAYSASKAALTQLARVAALELAADGVRVNVVHPDAVFDTGVWTPERLAERAARYGLAVADYRRRNLLRREVAAADVGALVAALAGDLFAKTTGAQIPIDGGNERVV